MKIAEVIVVEGKNDQNKLQSCFDCDCIITNGNHLNEKTLKQIEQIAHLRGVIVFTDDDMPGRLIRDKIQKRIPICKHAFIDKQKSHHAYRRKVGIEHATCQDLWESLQNVVTFSPKTNDITLQLLFNHGLLGENSASLRQKILKHYHLPNMNNKRLVKTLNLMGISSKELMDVLKTC